MRKKRILAVLLSSAIAFSGMPGNVFAAEDVALEDGFSDGETADVTENPTEEVGDIALEENQSQDSTGFIDGEIEAFTDENIVEDETDPETQLFSDDGETSSDVVETGKCGDNLTYTITGDETNGYTLTISGTGEMYDAKYTNEYNSKWIKYGQRFKTLILNDGITHIGARAFAGCDFTGELEIPESVTSIGFGAFSGCDFTGKLKIPQNVTYIGYRAFEYCTGFTGELEIPEGVKGIWSSTFEGCTGFTGKLKIPKSVTEIESSAFYRCTGFTGELEIPEGVTSIGQYAFSGCIGFAGKVKIPESVTYIGDSAFKACSGIESVEFVGNASIDPASFESCTNLHTITVFSNAYILGDKFTNCPLLNEIKGYIGSEAEKYAKKRRYNLLR